VKADIPNTAKDRELLPGGTGSQRTAGAPDRAGILAGAGTGPIGVADARTAVTALYQVHAVGLIRLAIIMTGDRQAAEDVVQEAFCGLFRRWAHLADKDKALSYVRSSALNGCRSELRRRIRNERRATRDTVPADAESAEYAALVGEEHREVLAALRRLPGRQREALVFRFYLDLSEAEVAAAMGISQGTVKSTTSRALAALGQLLEGDR
jgi:RNA polymerase sigma-70 factor (sigma-E family)